jgi:hypothetical protein
MVIASSCLSPGYGRSKNTLEHFSKIKTAVGVLDIRIYRYIRQNAYRGGILTGLFLLSKCFLRTFINMRMIKSHSHPAFRIRGSNCVFFLFIFR